MLYYCDRLMIRLLALGSSLTCQVSLKPATWNTLLRSFAVLDDTSIHLGWTRDKLSAARHTDSASNVPSMCNAFSLVPPRTPAVAATSLQSSGTRRGSIVSIGSRSTLWWRRPLAGGNVVAPSHTSTRRSSPSAVTYTMDCRQ